MVLEVTAGRCNIRNAMSTNHDLSFSKSTDNSSTRISIGASNTEGIVNRTGLDKYTFALKILMTFLEAL
jgi:hypothetical protein